jgi:hypothetical protein
MKLMATVVAVAALALAGCGGSGGGGGATTTASATTATATTGGSAKTGTGGAKVRSGVPPGAIPVNPAGGGDGGAAAAEASPGSAPSGPRSTGHLPDADSAAVSSAVRRYIAALDEHDAAAVCASIAPGGVPLGDLPRRRGGCRSSLRASIGTHPADGGPAWRSTRVVELKPEALEGDRARVTATVTHRFSDRNYVSVEDDVIYLERVAGRWLIAQPSATFYRAVGYAQLPLRAFAPPRGW